MELFHVLSTKIEINCKSLTGVCKVSGSVKVIWFLSYFKPVGLVLSLSQVRLLEMVTPRYLLASTVSNVDTVDTLLEVK
jgi:hypothetical protein